MEKTKSFVLDAEAVAIDKTSGKLMPFQELSKRKRKDVKVEDIQVKVCLFAFDLIYLNGEVCYPSSTTLGCCADRCASSHFSKNHSANVESC